MSFMGYVQFNNLLTILLGHINKAYKKAHPVSINYRMGRVLLRGYESDDQDALTV